MRIPKLRRAAIAFIAIGAFLVFAATVAAVVVIVKQGLTADSAAWVQAAGSIAAIVGAVWLFHADNSLRRRERRIAGEEVAWAVRFALTNAQLEAHTIATELISGDLLEGEDPGRHWLLRTANCGNILRLFAERTDHIHPALNHIASNGMLLLRQMDMDIERALVFVRNGKHPSMQVAQDIAWYEGHFELLLQTLDARMRGVLAALNDTSDGFPVGRFAPWELPVDKESRGAAKSPDSASTR